MKKIKNDSQPYRIYIFAIICLPFAAFFIGLCFYLSLLVFDGINFGSIYGTLLPAIILYLIMRAIKNGILYFIPREECYIEEKKLVYKRMLVIFAPILFSFVIAIFLYIATSKIQNRNEEIVSLIYMGGKITFFITLLPCLVIFFIIYISSSQKIRMLQKVYDFASKEEVNYLDETESLTELHSPKSKYIFTRKFFINWDGSLNIFILEDIEKIEYKKYNYFFIYGIKLLT